ncbi:MAG TPA: hypothetical protein VJS85_05965 [Rhizomicrobium sp.]|nr:hypothetical protein [Rhizomicrobium sp.]
MKHLRARTLRVRERSREGRGFLSPVTVKKIKEDCRALNADD